MIDVEWSLFARGQKPAIRVRDPIERAPEVRARIAHLGVAHVETTLAEAGVVLFYVARDRGLASTLADVETPILPGRAAAPPDAKALEAHARLGELLGYPRCCVEAYVARVARGVERCADGSIAHELFAAVEDALARSALRHSRLNTLRRGAGALVSFEPCRFDCPSALRLAAGGADAMSPADARALVTLLGAPAYVARDGARGLADAAPPDALVLRWDRA